MTRAQKNNCFVQIKYTPVHYIFKKIIQFFTWKKNTLIHFINMKNRCSVIYFNLSKCRSHEYNNNKHIIIIVKVNIIGSSEFFRHNEYYDEIYIRLNFAILPWNVIHISLPTLMSKLYTCVQHIKFKSTPTTSKQKRQIIKKHLANESQPKDTREIERMKKKIVMCIIINNIQ